MPVSMGYKERFLLNIALSYSALNSGDKVSTIEGSKSDKISSLKSGGKSKINWRLLLSDIMLGSSFFSLFSFKLISFFSFSFIFISSLLFSDKLDSFSFISFKFSFSFSSFIIEASSFNLLQISSHYSFVCFSLFVEKVLEKSFNILFISV